MATPKLTPEVDPGSNGETLPQTDSTPMGRRTPPPTPVGKNKSTPNTNANKAGQATDVLMRLNSFAAFGARMFQYDLTADALDNANDPFREAVYDALLIDPELAAWIMRGGTESGKIALLLAYLMLIGAVAPVAVLEHKDKRAEKQAKLKETEQK